MQNDLVGRTLVRSVADHWWMMALRGLAAVVFGVLTLASPGTSLMAIVFFWGAYAVVDGVVNLTLGFQALGQHRRWGWLVFSGVVGVAAGIVTFVWPGLTAMVLLAVISVWAIVTGFAAIAAAVRLRRHIRGEWLLGLSGALSVAFGVLLLARPAVGTIALLWTIGVYAIAFGAIVIGLGFRLRSWRGAERQLPEGGVPV